MIRRLIALPLVFTFAVSAQAQTPKKAAKPVLPLPQKSAPKEPTATQPEPAQGEEQKRNRVSVDPTSAVRVVYGYKLWNKSPSQIDSATLLMREGASGRTVQVQLSETEPDSSIFSGLYSINWKNIDRLQIEFYIPPQELTSGEAGLKKLTAMIGNETLKRKPFILRRTLAGQQNIEIFDTKEQARAAMKAYRAEQQIALQNQKTTKFPSDQDLDTARLAEEMRLKEETARLESERLRLEQLEAQRIEQLRQQQALLAASEKEANRKKAEEIAAEALSLFKQEKFEEAKQKFDQAVSLDPNNRLFYFQYGVALYKIEDFNRSLVILGLADGPNVNDVERNYFIALNHFRMREFENALTVFDKVIATRNPSMSPSAQFYKGVVLFEQRNWDLSQAAFQAVLDTSSDSALDDRAEGYIEQILRIRQYEEEAKRKWLISATFGEMYDSNILLIADSQRDSGIATDTAGYRTLFMGSAKYRPLYEETREFAAQLDVITMLTLDTQFQTDQDLRNADPTVATLTLPYTVKGMLFGKGHKLDLIPGYETTYMSIEDNSNKEILSSILLGVSSMLVMSDDWFATYLLDIRSDDSKLTSSTGDEDSSALKVKIANSNMIFLTEDKSRILIAEGGFTINSAQGKNAVYNRLDLGVGYIRPWHWDTSASFNLSAYTLNYPQNATNRADSSFTLSAGLSKKLTDVWSTGFLTSYNINQSNQDVNKYNKFTALLTLSATTGF